MRGWRSARAASVGVACASLALIGCALPKPPPEIAPGTSTGPSASIGERLGKHIAGFECPSPGWGAEFDQLRDAPQGWTHAFITLRTPSPIFVYPQVITRQEVLLEVPVTRPVRVYVRTVDHDSPAEGAYRLAGEAAAMKDAEAKK